MKLQRRLLTWSLLPACVSLAACSPADPVGGGNTGGSAGSAGSANPSGGAGAGGAGTGGSTSTGGSAGVGTGGAAGGLGGTGAGGLAAGGAGGIGGAGAGGSAGAQGGDELTGVEVPGENCPVPSTWPSFGELQDHPKLHDPFTMIDGTKVTTKAQWACRHREIRALVEHWETGPKEVNEATVTGSVSGGDLKIDVTGGDEDVSFTVGIELPNTGTPPYPAMIQFGGSLDNNKLKSMGVAIISFDHQGLQPEGNRNNGIFAKFHGNPGTGSLMAWAWGTSRIIDALEKTPDANINPQRLGVTGCSRNGKGALMAGAMDSRFALVIPQESGSGGVAAWRVSEVDNGGQTGSAGVQNLIRTYGEAEWFGEAIEQFGNAVTKLPLDHHQLVAMVAPRGLFVIGNLNYTWLSTNNADQAGGAARLVYEALGAKDNMGYVDTGHGHCGLPLPAAQQNAVDAFVKKFLLDDASANTAEHWSPANDLDTAQWVDWTAPTLQ